MENYPWKWFMGDFLKCQSKYQKTPFVPTEEELLIEETDDDFEAFVEELSKFYKIAEKSKHNFQLITFFSISLFILFSKIPNNFLVVGISFGSE